MKVEIFSRAAMEKFIQTAYPKNTAVICFYYKIKPDFYPTACNLIYYVNIPDIDKELLEKYGYTYDTYIEDSDRLAEFIYNAKRHGFDIICQCDYGQSRSAACAAAILQHFKHCGIEIFADYRYYPNQLVYHRVIEALERYKNKQAI